MLETKDIYRIAEEAAEPFRKQVNAGGIDTRFAAGYWEGLNTMRRAVEEALRKQGR